MAGKYLKKSIKRKSRYILAGALVCTLILLLTFSGAADTAQKVWIVSYGDQDTTVTSSQLLEVKTSGFADNACLIYFYENETMTLPDNNIWSNVEQKNYLYVFPNPDTYSYSVTNQYRDFFGGFFDYKNFDWGSSSGAQDYDTNNLIVGIPFLL